MNPLFFDTLKDFKKLELEVSAKLDLTIHCLEELFDIEHPWLKSGNAIYEKTFENFVKVNNFSEQFVYYPWNKTLIQIPDINTFRKLRTSRNRDLVTEKEQTILLGKNIAIAGMSVGSNILNSLVMSAVGGCYSIADLDTISIPNLNRISGSLLGIGKNKAEFFAQKNFEVDPYIKIETFTKGLNRANFIDFFQVNSTLKCDLFIEEMDDPYLKVQSRKFAREHRIPVVMATDNGDGIFIDVERFDIEPTRPLFHGRISEAELDTYGEKISFIQRLTMASRIAGLPEATSRMQDSISKVGNTLNTWPQLGTAAVLAGVASVFTAKQIFLNEMPSGRYYISLESLLVHDYDTDSSRVDRERHTKATMNSFESFKQFQINLQKILE